MKQAFRFGFLMMLTWQTACDPAFDYEPNNWEPAEEYDWKCSFGAFEIQMHSLRGLVGSRGISLDLDIKNQADQPLVLEEAVILAEDKTTYQAELPGELEVKWRTIEAKKMGRVEISWYFNRPAPIVLGQQPQLTLKFRYGEETSEVQIQYRKVE